MSETGCIAGGHQSGAQSDAQSGAQSGAQSDDLSDAQPDDQSGAQSVVLTRMMTLPGPVAMPTSRKSLLPLPFSLPLPSFCFGRFPVSPTRPPTSSYSSHNIFVLSPAIFSYSRCPVLLTLAGTGGMQPLP